MLLVLSFALCAALPRPQQGYKTPPKEIVELLDAALPPSPRISPQRNWMVLVERAAMPSIADVAKPWIGLAGLRIDPATNARQEIYFDSGLVLRDLLGEKERRIALPPEARVGSLSWSHTGQRFAFTLTEEDDVELWVCDVESAQPRRVAEHLNTVLGGFDWMSDGERIIATLVPPGRAPAPKSPRAPQGPAVQESSGKHSPVRTFQDLLRDEHDAQLFEHFGLSQLVILDPRDASTTTVGRPALIAGFAPSPDGEHVLVSTLHRPFSYVLTASRFPRRTEVWNLRGELERLVVDAPLQDEIPIEGVQTGPRSVGWRVGESATLVWVEALDGGDPKLEVAQRDRWMTLPAPFKVEAQELFRVQYRARGLTWLSDPDLLLASEYDRDRRWTRTTLRSLSEARIVSVLEDRSVNDRYGDPGRIEMTTRLDGTSVPVQTGDWIFRSGEGQTSEGARPFLDRQNLVTCVSERLWQCSGGSYERVATLIDLEPDGVPRFVTRREAPTEPPNLVLHDLVAKSARRLTDFPDPQPQIRGIRKELVTYRRDDGLQLSATLYLPPDYVEGTRLPLVVWAYPLEYSDPATAGQVSGSPDRFTLLRGISQLLFVMHGYAVMDGATMPIVGDPETMNDTFVEQIAAAAKAAIDYAAGRGVADPERVGVGGHSYGAFMTANLLAHTDLFKAGCARSGAYNRTLTPFGFQSERRTLWEAPAVYARVSPFFHADKINEPLLLIHGEKDPNPGTFPMQSERLYQAISGNGGTARWVVLPEEAHGYSARESVLHTVAETFEWFDRYVRDGAAVDAAAERKGR